MPKKAATDVLGKLPNVADSTAFWGLKFASTNTSIAHAEVKTMLDGHKTNATVGLKKVFAKLTPASNNNATNASAEAKTNKQIIYFMGVVLDFWKELYGIFDKQGKDFKKEDVNTKLKGFKDE
eukprot:TRINITY_DN6885_c0_g1_i1.p1 TRINITY_DN6885_c0_g1~~TRINITY_DN6885_c0_g1_i1.p1  ORF type:complete len:123 (+),score=17.91 TRINITY_DN6885_c0_g1_i1:322-690(+)